MCMLCVCACGLCMCICTFIVGLHTILTPSLHTLPPHSHFTPSFPTTSLLMDHTLPPPPPPHSMAHTGLSSTWPPSTGGCQVIPRTQWSVSGGPSTLPLQRPRMWATSDWPAFFIAMVTFLMQWWLQGQPWTSLEAR